MHKTREKIIFSALMVLAAVVLFPMLYMVIKSFDGENGSSLMAYYEIFLAEPGYLIKFWRSLLMSLIIAAAQTLVSCMAALSFSKYKFRGRKLMFLLMVLFVVLPIQVTLLPNYLLLDKLNLLNTWWALILPNIFAPFGTVWLTFIFLTVPDDIINAAKMDGANSRQIIWEILIPNVKAPIVTLFLLSFVESWNMVEQPLTFLQDVSQYPLSVFLVLASENHIAMQSVCGILCFIPVTLLFFYYHEEFVEGISNSFGNY